MVWRLLDSVDGISTYFKSDGGKNYIRRVSDVQANLDKNAQEKSNSSSGWKGDWHKVASIPLIVIEQWQKELGEDPLAKRNRKWLIAKLNNSDFGKLRTKEGRLGHNEFRHI